MADRRRSVSQATSHPSYPADNRSTVAATAKRNHIHPIQLATDHRRRSASQAKPHPSYPAGDRPTDRPQQPSKITPLGPSRRPTDGRRSSCQAQSHPPYPAGDRPAAAATAQQHHITGPGRQPRPTAAATAKQNHTPHPSDPRMLRRAPESASAVPKNAPRSDQ